MSATNTNALQAAQEKMNKTHTANTAVAAQGQPKNFSQLLTAMKSQIEMALPKHMNAERIMRIALTAYNSNPKLAQCEVMSILGALMTSAQLGLEPNTPLGQAYIIPYNGKAQFQLGYKGVLDLCYRTGSFKRISAHEVYKNDSFEYEYGLNQILRHKPADMPEGEATKYYAVYELKDGGTGMVVASREKIIAHAKKYSKSFGNGPWVSDFDEMAKKTLILEVLKYAPKSIEISKALVDDGAVRSEIKSDMSEVASEMVIDMVTGEVKG
jgi:recombination protein RecT